jgi:hypothetical protein
VNVLLAGDFDRGEFDAWRAGLAAALPGASGLGAA